MRVHKFITAMLAMCLLAPTIVGTGFFTPRIENHGDNKPRSIVDFDDVTGLGSPQVFACMPGYPILVLQPSDQIAQPGEALSYATYIKNSDSSDCGVSTFDLSASVPFGFSASFSQNSVILQPNGSVMITTYITSASTSSVGTFPFSVSASSETSSLSGSGSSSYQILGDRGQGISLTITPLSSNIFYQGSYAFANFQIIFTNGQAGIRINPPHSKATSTNYAFLDTPSTGSDGSYLYDFLVDPSLYLGEYTVTVTTTYNGTQYSASTNFSIDLPFP